MFDKQDEVIKAFHAEIENAHYGSARQSQIAAVRLEGRSLPPMRSGEGKIQFNEARWPLLRKLLSEQYLGYVDFALANQLLDTTATEAIAAFICHLSMSVRRGHICIRIEKDALLPHPADIWIPEEFQDRNPQSEDSFETLSLLIRQGAKEIIDTPLCHLKTENEKDPITPVYHDGNRYYLQRYWSLETLCLNHLKRHFLDEKLFPEKNPPHHQIEEQVMSLSEQGKLLPEQAQAILKASKSLLTLITGGPGTGKTYTAGLLLRTIWNAIPVEEKNSFKIALAAPTGKAAANLEASIRQALASVTGFPPIAAQTLHQLLKIGKSGRPKQPEILMADLVLVDESSMIDVNLMRQLFQAIRPGARLVLLGDRHQLPSVEAGAIFADLISCFESSQHKHIAVAKLKTCLRAELKGILDLAASVNEGNEQESISLLNGSSNGIRRINEKNGLSGKQRQKELVSHALPHFPVITHFSEDQDPWSALKHFSRFRILTPMRKGFLGVESLNAAIFQIMQQKMCCVFPIIVMENDYRLGLFNGEVGLLIKENNQDFALFASRESSEEVRRIPRILMPPFEYAYCLSIHKSQGSEFDHVLLLLPEGAQSFGREALYTGITRAKKQLEIWSADDTLKQMIGSVALRQSGIVERLK